MHTLVIVPAPESQPYSVEWDFTAASQKEEVMYNTALL